MTRRNSTVLAATAALATALTACGGTSVSTSPSPHTNRPLTTSSSSTPTSTHSSGELSDNSTCRDWNKAKEKARLAYADSVAGGGGGSNTGATNVGALEAGVIAGATDTECKKPANRNETIGSIASQLTQSLQ